VCIQHIQHYGENNIWMGEDSGSCVVEYLPLLKLHVFRVAVKAQLVNSPVAQSSLMYEVRGSNPRCRQALIKLQCLQIVGKLESSNY